MARSYALKLPLVLLLVGLALLGAICLSVLSPRHISAQSAWAPNVTYSTGAQVTYDGKTYKCIQGHTSQTGWEPPNVPALWQLVVSGPTATRTRTSASATITRTPTRMAPTATVTRTWTSAPVTVTRTRTRSGTLGPSPTRTRTSTLLTATTTRTRTAPTATVTRTWTSAPVTVTRTRTRSGTLGPSPTRTRTSAPPTPTATRTRTPTPLAGWTPRWTGDPARGLAMFEGVEEDRADSHPAVNHIYMSGSNVRFDMHLQDRDESTDRQRHEVKGMNVAGVGDLRILQGQTWRFTYEMYMPGSMTGGNHFSHLFQQKMVSDAGSSGPPLVTLSTTIVNGTEQLALRSLPGGNLGGTPLAPLRDKWIQVEMEFKFDFAARGGYARVAIRADGVTLVNATRSNIDMFANEGTTDRRVRPKWGIYRSIESAGLKDTHLMLRNLKAYQKQ